MSVYYLSFMTYIMEWSGVYIMGLFHPRIVYLDWRYVYIYLFMSLRMAGIWMTCDAHMWSILIYVDHTSSIGIGIRVDHTGIEIYVDHKSSIKIGICVDHIGIGIYVDHMSSLEIWMSSIGICGMPRIMCASHRNMCGSHVIHIQIQGGEEP